MPAIPMEHIITSPLCPVEMSGFGVFVFVLVVSYWPARALLNMDLTNLTFFSKPGDFSLGGLFSLHKEVDVRRDDSPICKNFNLQEFMGLLAMKFTVDEINNRSDILPNISLGYEMYDTCSDTEVILQAALRFLAERNDRTLQVLCNYTDYKTRMLAVIGPSTSDMVLLTGKMFGFFHLPQVSYLATSERLSDKSTFPSFLRTIPSDSCLTQAMVQLLKAFQWNWVIIIYSKNEYGKQGLIQFTTKASQAGICVAYQTFIPENISDPNFNTSLQKTFLEMKNTGVNVTILLSSLPETLGFFKAVIGSQIKMVWIASTSWSQSQAIQQLPGIQSTGTVIGFAVQSKTLPGFEDYARNILHQIQQDRQVLLYNSSTNLNGSLKYILQTQDLHEQCQSCSVLTPDNITTLQAPAASGLVYRVYIAIYCIAQALHNVIYSQKSQQCMSASSTAPWQVLKELTAPNFSLGNVTFDMYGNPNIGYDILTWIYNRKSSFLMVGSFQEKLTLNKAQIVWHTTKTPESTCSRKCSPGEVQTIKDFKSCCSDCVTCPEGTYANDTECTSCPAGQWSKPGSITCQHPTFLFLQWTNHYVIALLGFMGLIVCLIVAAGVILFQHRHTILFVACGGVQCYIILLGLLCMCVSIFFYIGQPYDWMCLLQQPLLSISFATLLGPLLVKSMQLLFCSLSSRSCLYKLIHPGRWFILICALLGQIFFCVLYIKATQPFSMREASMEVSSLAIYLSCKNEPLLQFGLMFAYNGLLVLICFLCSFMAEKPVHQYYMARDITLAMLTLILAWIIFIPTYVSTDATNKSLIQMIFILSSCLGVLSAVFFPKCYLLIYNKELNSSEYFGTYIPTERTETATE